MVNTCHNVLNPNVNYGLWVIMMHQYRFIGCRKGTTVVRDVGNGGGVRMWGWGASGNSPYFLLFCCETKTPLKTNSIKNCIIFLP